MYLKPIFFVLSVCCIVMALVDAVEYNDYGPGNDQIVQLHRYFGMKPRLGRSEMWNMAKSQRQDRKGLYNSDDSMDEKFSENSIPSQDDDAFDTKLIRTSRLQHLRSLDFLYNQDHKPRFGKRTYMYGNWDREIPMVNSYNFDNWSPYPRRR